MRGGCDRSKDNLRIVWFRKGVRVTWELNVIVPLAALVLLWIVLYVFNLSWNLWNFCSFRVGGRCWIGVTRQVKVTVKCRKILSEKYSREWRYSAWHWAWLRMRSIIARNFRSNLFVIREKCMKMRMRAFGLRCNKKRCVDIAGLHSFVGERWTLTSSGVVDQE